MLLEFRSSGFLSPESKAMRHFLERSETPVKMTEVRDNYLYTNNELGYIMSREDFEDNFSDITRWVSDEELA